LEQHFRFIPIPIGVRLAQRQHHLAVAIFRHDHRLHRVADLQVRHRFGRNAFHFPVRDDAFRLGTDIDQDFVRLNPDDSAAQYVAALRMPNLEALRVEQLLH